MENTIKQEETVEDKVQKIKDELDKRLSIILSEPNGIVRETMINNFLIDI